MNEIKFPHITGRTLTYTVRKPDGTLRGPADIPLPETPPSSGYYTNSVARPDLVVGDMVIIKDSETGNPVGTGEWKPEDASGGKADLPNEQPIETGGNATSAKGWEIWTCVKKVVEKGWQIFTKSFWDSVLERWWPK